MGMLLLFATVKVLGCVGAACFHVVEPVDETVAARVG